MELRTYRAKSLQEAIRMVRTDLGPDASVLHTREVRGGMLRWLGRPRQIEVTASATVNVPSRFADGPQTTQDDDSQDCRFVQPQSHQIAKRGQAEQWADLETEVRIPAADEVNYREVFRQNLHDEPSETPSMIESLSHRFESPSSRFDYSTEIVDGLISTESNNVPDLVGLVKGDINCCGPIQLTPGKTKVVALVGPTGVGKTTTIAKLAASHHLKEHHRVGLITVDTYRVAAAEQLRTYADIIALPMFVVSNLAGMREAVARLAGFDLILVDTAGQSPRDKARTNELRSLFDEGQIDEVHLVLSSVASGASLRQAVRQFADVGANALILTKLDEAAEMGNLAALVRNCDIPVSYVTNGQEVPDDISPADPERLAQSLLGLGDLS